MRKTVQIAVELVLGSAVVAMALTVVMMWVVRNVTRETGESLVWVFGL